MNEREKGFIQGQVWAIALLCQFGHMEPDQMWQEAGLNNNDLEVCDDYDVNIIKKVLYNA